MRIQRRKLAPPDGGWGWCACLGSSLITLSLRSLDPSFGLLFGDLLRDLKVDTTGASVIISMMDAVVNFSGLFVGPLLKRFSYRTVAFGGAMLSCTGIIVTSQANSMVYIICTYSIFAGLGTGFAVAASFVALNSYFEKKRGQAVGFSMAGTALAMMFLPQLIHALLEVYDFRGTVLILGGFALHAVVGACLLQPVGWHMKPTTINEEMKVLTEVGDAPLEEGGRQKKISIKNIASHMSSIDLTHSCLHLDRTRCNTADDKVINDAVKPDEKRSLLQTVVVFLDLDLLKDPAFLNILLGLCLFYVAEVNFKFVTPFFLSNIGMTRAEVASCLTLTAFTDILARLIVPTICDRLKFKKRHVFWFCSMCLGACRSAMVEQTSRTMLMVMLIVNGFLRGATLTNMQLTIPENCSMEKLPAAIGIFMVSKGLFVVTIGPIVGYIRDASGSYNVCVHTMTALIALCSLTWSLEYCFRNFRVRRRSEPVSGERSPE